MATRYENRTAVEMAEIVQFEWSRPDQWVFANQPVMIGVDLASGPDKTVAWDPHRRRPLTDEEVTELVKPPKWSPPPIPMWPVGSVTYVDEKFVEPPAISTAEICRQAMEKIHENLSPPITATDVRRRWASMPDPFAGWNKAIIDRMFEIMREQKLIPEPPAALAPPVAAAPLPPNLFNRMERNRGSRVAGAAHFVDGME